MSNEIFDEKNESGDLYGWYSAAPAPTQRSRRPLYIVILCIALALVFAFGMVLGYMVSGSSSDEASLFAETLESIKKYYYYYGDVDDETWAQAVAEAGTSMLNGIGDRYGHLLTPQQFYNLMNPVASSSSDSIFGIGYQPYGTLGLYISEVVADGSAYGLLQEGDIVLRVDNPTTADGSKVKINSVEVDSIDLSQYASSATQMQQVLGAVYSGTFRYLRNGEMGECTLTRGKIGLENDDFEFVEYYFDQTNCNVSLHNVNNAQHNTYELRLLSNLPSNVGYVRLKEFSDAEKVVLVNGRETTKITSVYSEFREVMDKFAALGKEYLILDLKGNPGGDVELVSDVAALLVTAAGLPSQYQTNSEVVKSNGDLLITKLEAREGLIIDADTFTNVSYVYRTSEYNKYFGNYNASKCKIVIWTDGGSASASELLTGALRDYGTGFQIGTNTFGKGIAQTVMPLDGFTGPIVKNDGSKGTENWALYVTFAQYYPPVSENIHGKGYAPAAGYTAETYEQLWQKTLQYWGLSQAE